MDAFRHVRGGELPVLVRGVCALEKTPLLFGLGNVQEKLYNDDTVAVQVTLEAANVLEAFVPDLPGHESGRDLFPAEEFGMNPNNQRLLVITAIEDADGAPIRQALEERQR